MDLIWALHLIYVPEIQFSQEKFLSHLNETFSRYDRAVVVVSEGLNDGQGNYFAANGKFDSHGNPELDGQILARDLGAMVQKSGITKRVRADVFGYIQRSFPLFSEIDQREAEEVGRRAVQFALEGARAGSVAIKREPGKLYSVRYELVPLQAVAREPREMPREFMNEEGNHVTPAFLDYVRPLVGTMPLTARL